MPIVLLAIVGTTIWVAYDSKAIGARKGQFKGFADMGPVEWAVGCLLLWIVVFPLYLAKRPQIKALAQPPVR